MIWTCVKCGAAKITAADVCTNPHCEWGKHNAPKKIEVGATPGTYVWIKKATEVLRAAAIAQGVPGSSLGVQIDALLSGVPCQPEDLGFNSPADRYAREWKALNERHGGDERDPS